MFTRNDISCRTIFVINGLEGRKLRVSSGELLLEEKNEETGKNKTLTKIPFQKVLALLVIGHISITTPLLEKCQRYGVSLIVVKQNLRPVFFWNVTAEANFLLRQRQYLFPHDDLTIARALVKNKITNQLKALSDTRRKDPLSQDAKERCRNILAEIDSSVNYTRLMGLEGAASRAYFSAFFQDLCWVSRQPRIRTDAVNATLDIGYTLLFNYLECFLRLFGFDLYVGVYHRLWFKRKSLVCDLIEPFRCLVDKATRNAFNRNQFSEKDFVVTKGEYLLKKERSGHYHKTFLDVLIPYKNDLFLYVQKYYRCFMGQKTEEKYPNFIM